MEDGGIESYLVWLLILTVMGVNASTFGFLFGCIIVQPVMCIMISYFFLVLIYFGGGAFVNYQGEENLG